ncbi:MAG: DUF342 domain-containing protein [Lachnospiraceae bacterium]|nr:DUF342 domain-containing protein [Lachnospiraceae bacterium]
MAEEQIINNNDGIEITTTQDDMEAYLLLRPREGGYTVGLLKSRLNEMGITTACIMESVITEMVEKEQYGTSVKVAEGIRPFQGVDGWYEYMFNTEVNDKPKILADGSVDYSQFGDIASVEEGAVVAVYHPAVEAKDGVNLYGELLVASKGRNLAKLSGRGFFCQEDGCTYVAKYGGKITYYDGHITINEEMVVEGDVSVATGDIDFRHDVRVKGNVYAGVSIISQKGSILVDGYVEGANLQAHKDITLKNGMQGNGRGVIKAGGNVSGKFFEQSSVEAGGNVNANSIMNSQIKAGEDVTVSGRFGIIIGGTTSAERQIQATIIGNTAEVDTRIYAGIPGDLMAMLNRNEHQKQQTAQEIDKISQGLSTIDEMLESGDNPDLMQKKRMLMRSKIEKDSALSELEKQNTKLVEQMTKANQAKVIINKLVYPGTEITVNGLKTQVKEEETHIEFARRSQGIIKYHIGEG